MSKIIVLYNYSKYYNRIEKKLSSFNDYLALITPVDNNTPAAYKGFTRSKVNFDYVDGVSASLVLNISKSEATTYKVDQPDYCVVETEYKEGEGVSQTTVKQLSRWFILQCTKIRGNQWEISLRRDLIADNYEAILSAPTFIERGIPSNLSDPAIFNRESFTYNQIKQKELKLDFNKRSGKGGGWIVGYLAREDGNGNITHIDNAQGHAEIPEGTYQWADLSAELRGLITNGSGYYPANYFLHLMAYVNNRATGIDYQIMQFTTFSDYSQSGDIIESENNSYLCVSANAKPYVYFKKYQGRAWYSSEVRAKIKTAYTSYAQTLEQKIDDYYSSLTLSNRISSLSTILSYNDTVYEKDGKLYKIKITKSNSVNYEGIAFTPAQLRAGSGGNPALAVALNNFYNNGLFNSVNILADNDNPSVDCVSAGIQEDVYIFSVEEAEYDVIKASIPNTRNENLEAPYDIFCIPIGAVSVKSSGSTILTNVANTAIAIARGIAVKGTATLVYDIQILPYCPFDEILNSDGDIDITGFASGKDFSYITKTENGVDTEVGIILYPKSCRGTFDLSIPSNSDVYNDCLEETVSVIEKKIKSETRLCRFVSPNFASIFEINVQKNKGIVNLNVDYFYKPYSPYIHVAPYFNGLYGQDFNDPKGLICSGDFSIATASSKWEEYQIANKNYELIFNRQLQNLDVNNSIAMDQLKITGRLGVVTSAIQGVAAGAVTGATAGSMAGPWGTVIGAVGGAAVGGVTSGIASSWGASKDIEFLAKSQQEARSYMVDMYTYQLGNIQALPNTLTKVSTFTENNKIFPFIEFYDCTDEEKQALRDKIKYNGMTIMRIGRIRDFIGETSNYVQGQLIRLTGINEDSYVVSETANEIKQGAYYYGNDSE